VEFNIADLFESVVDAVPDRLALVAGKARLTYRELEARTNRLASFLRSRGVGKGSHVGLHLWNGAEFVESMLAVFKLRAVPININYRYVEDELRQLCTNADLAALVSQTDFLPAVESVEKSCKTLETVVLVGGAAEGATPNAAHFAYERCIERGSPARDFPKRSGEDLYIIYTGGTTGAPKGVMWRHEDVFFAGLQGGNAGGAPIERAAQLADNVREGRVMALRMLPAAPFIHGAAQWACLICFFSGGTVVLQPGRSFSAARILELVGEEKVQTITLVGDAMARPLLEELTSAPERYDLQSLFVIASAGAVLSPVVKERFRAILPSVMMVNSFGSTEAGHQGSGMPGYDLGTDGRPSFMMDASSAVLDDERRRIEPGSGKVGWIARSGRVPLGYYKDPDKTAARFVTLEGRRWVLPGDRAMVEADGRITVLGRGSECINTGGEKVFPEEVEEALKSHPDVFDALVVGIEDERWMQRVAAVVEPVAGKTPSPDSLREHCRAVIAGYKVPRQIALVDKVSRFPTGKPDYAWARDIAKNAGVL